MRSFLAVFVGFALWSVLWLAGNAAIQAAFPGAYPEGFPEHGTLTAVQPLAACLILSVACSLGSGSVAARLAAQRYKPVVVLACLLLAVGVGVQASAWNAMPLWYHVPFLALLVPVCLLGGVLTPRPR